MLSETYRAIRIYFNIDDEWISLVFVIIVLKCLKSDKCILCSETKWIVYKEDVATLQKKVWPLLG
ncbi:hypothetical protein SAMN05443550_12311 [Pedobacter hartonius]|uniref:Uncharacterized protein n=1 Tax=Pedobacter hartonius TaxID=425514 RepID=A0A1H4HJ78_9SPHI|nr:hypothetical protein SAMN05443550_12311 [Pedobacter hartonius]